MASIRQTSFAAGALDPALHGRTDLPHFGMGARKLHNAFVNRAGAVVSRPGTKLVSTCKKPDVVLLPFIYSDTQSYVVELGAGYLRIHGPNGYAGVELVTTYQAADLPTLQYAQTGYIMTLTHPRYAPMELRSPMPTQGGNLTAWSFKPCRFGPPGDLFDDPSLQAFFMKPDATPTSMPAAVNTGELFVKDANHPPKPWIWQVATLVQNTQTGELAETLPRTIDQFWNGISYTTLSAIPAGAMFVVYPTAAVTLKSAVGGAVIPKPSWWVAVGQVWYRGLSLKMMGFLGTTRYATPFVDDGALPDYTRAPLRGESPFASGEQPISVAFFQQRRVFAGSSARPATLWASATDEWRNHDKPFAVATAIAENSPIEFTFASRKRERVRSMVSLQRLLVFTDTSVWSVGGGESPMTPKTLQARVEDEVGATSLQPLVVDGAVLYVRSKGRGVRALVAAEGGYSYAGVDVSWHASHFFRGAGGEVVSWCYARDPFGVIWAVRADGTLLSCTRTGESMWAWCSHSTVDGKVLSVASVPEGRADAVYVAVRRGAATYIERQSPRDVDFNTPITVDDDNGGVSLDAHVTGVGNVDAEFVVTGLAHLEGKDVWAVAPGNAPLGPLRVTGGQVTVGPFEKANQGGAQVAVAVGLPVFSDVGTLDAAPQAVRTNQKTVISVGFEVIASRGLQVGEDEAKLVPWQQRRVTDGYDFPSAASDLVVVNVKGKWARTGRAFLRQAEPLAFTLLGITREVDVGGS
ncbi:MAG: hypothetical protein DI536_04240 [Archangium gephyra]|uniref:Phage protein n=1 Tax=Archangium gephyra TaxID=48 RepID=A0A2W5TPD7_9BACT|nr:MAG: hypothetical protein DI536_04240 [Archangium gephyra]